MRYRKKEYVQCTACGAEFWVRLNWRPSDPCPYCTGDGWRGRLKPAIAKSDNPGGILKVVKPIKE